MVRSVGERWYLGTRAGTSQRKLRRAGGDACGPRPERAASLALTGLWNAVGGVTQGCGRSSLALGFVLSALQAWGERD